MEFDEEDLIEGYTIDHMPDDFDDYAEPDVKLEDSYIEDQKPIHSLSEESIHSQTVPSDSELNDTKNVLVNAIQNKEQSAKKVIRSIPGQNSLRIQNRSMILNKNPSRKGIDFLLNFGKRSLNKLSKPATASHNVEQVADNTQKKNSSHVKKILRCSSPKLFKKLNDISKNNTLNIYKSPPVQSTKITHIFTNLQIQNNSPLYSKISSTMVNESGAIPYSTKQPARTKALDYKSNMINSKKKYDFQAHCPVENKIKLKLSDKIPVADKIRSRCSSPRLKKVKLCLQRLTENKLLQFNIPLPSLQSFMNISSTYGQEALNRDRTSSVSKADDVELNFQQKRVSSEYCDSADKRLKINSNSLSQIAHNFKSSHANESSDLTKMETRINNKCSNEIEEENSSRENISVVKESLKSFRMPVKRIQQNENNILPISPSAVEGKNEQIFVSVENNLCLVEVTGADKPDPLELCSAVIEDHTDYPRDNLATSTCRNETEFQSLSYHEKSSVNEISEIESMTASYRKVCKRGNNFTRELLTPSENLIEENASNMTNQDHSGSCRNSAWNETENKSAAGNRTRVIEGTLSNYEIQNMLSNCQVEDVIDASAIEKTLGELQECLNSEKMVTVDGMPIKQEEEEDAGNVTFNRPMKCERCSGTFTTNRHLLAHLRAESCSSAYFPCSDCSSVFTKKEHLTVHVKSMHLRIRPYRCHYCQKDFPKNCAMVKHMESVHLKIRPFKCQEFGCTMAFGNKTRLNNHINHVHLKIRPFKCPRCPKYFICIQHVKTHVKCVHDKVKNFLCDCGARFSMKGDLNKHIRAVHNKEKAFKCLACPTRFTFEKDSVRHYKTVHLRIRPHSCSMCHLTFSTNYMLMKHVQSVHEKIRPYICEICNAKFGSKENLTIHVNSIHLSVRPYECDFCHKKYTSKLYLKDHITAVHHKLRPFQCSHCDKTFALKKKMLRHINGVHLLSRPHACTECDRKFAVKRNLQVHIDYVHRKLRPHQCEKCYKKFGLKSELNSHLYDFHNVEKPYRCQYCPSTFSVRHNCKMHEDAVHKKLTPHECDICYTSFTQKRGLINHMDSVHQKLQKFECPFCQEFFASRALVERHVLSMHPED